MPEFLPCSCPEKGRDLMSKANAEKKVAEWFVGVTAAAVRSQKINPPPIPLAEVVKTVAQHQAAGFSPSTVAEV